MQAIQELWELIELWKLQNSIREAVEWDRLIDKKPSNPIKNWGGKPTFQKRATVLRALATLLGIGRQRRSINKKPSNPSRKQGRKTERLGLGFFSSNPEPALPLQRGIERFNYYELPSSQVSRSFLVVLKDSVNLVCSCSRGSMSRSLDIHPERGNSLCRLNAHCKESGQPYAPRAPQPSLFAELIMNANTLRLNSLAFFLAPIYSCLLALLFNDLDELCELNTWSDPCR